jgi:hypothetical protein
MKKLIDYLKNLGQINELYSNHKRSLIEVQTKNEILWIFRYVSQKDKVVYGLSKLISTKEGKGKIINTLEAKVLKNQISLKKEIEKLNLSKDESYQINHDNHSMEYIL